MNNEEKLRNELSIKSGGDQPYERVRNCQSCGCITFIILKDYRLRCFECDEPFRFEDQPENWQAHDPQDDIDNRLGMIAELFPWRLSYSVDEEGLALLRTTVQGCVGDFRITDFGGGPLTAMHLETVLAHVRHAEIMVWLNNESDVRMIRAASAAVNAAAACGCSRGG
jgi:hypothetical protein